MDDQPRTELELKPEPALRWSNPAVGSIHGGVFLWTHRGRPAAVASIFKWFDPRDDMAFEVQSLSASRLVGFLGTNEAWHSTRAGVEFKPVPGAPPAPARTATTRLTQMRTMSNAFTVEKTDRDDDSKQRMRLLTQPIFRYSSPTEGIIPARRKASLTERCLPLFREPIPRFFCKSKRETLIPDRPGTTPCHA